MKLSGRTGRRARTGLCPGLEWLEGRALLAPFSVGGDPIVNPAEFRVTAMASGLNFPTGVLAQSDGSLLVVENVPPAGGTSFYSTTARVIRLVDTTGDGVADGVPSILADGLPGADSAIAQAGPYVITTSSFGTISFLRRGATPTSSFTLAGKINLSFPSPWLHTTYALAVRPAPGKPGDYNVFFNVGSQFNGIKKDSAGNILYDSNGVAIPDPTIGKVSASGLISATLDGDSIYMVTLHDNAGTPVLSGLTKVATGLRNAASMAINPATGDLLFADNGMDGTNGGNEAYSTDTLHRIASADIGKSVQNCGFPYSYTLTNDVPGSPDVVINPASRVPPLASYQPLKDPNLPSTGSESEGASGFAIAPANFPAGLNSGVFVGFHGVFNTGGTANTENPMVYTDTATGKYFDFISNNEPNIGHIDGAASTADSLFISDVASTGRVFGSPGTGVIYQIKAQLLPDPDGWQGYARDPQHTATSEVASSTIGSIRWQTPVDLDPQYSGDDLLIHYGSPLVTAANTVIVPVKTGATGGFSVKAFSGDNGASRWTLTSDYTLMPSGGTNGYSWIPSYSPTLTPSNRLYYAGIGGTILYTGSPDSAGPGAPPVSRLAFYGLSNYTTNPSAYNNTVFVNTPITSDAAGNIYFGFLVTGSNPLGLKSGVARIGADGVGSYTTVVTGMTQVATNSAPALSNDGNVLYVLESTGNFGSGKLVALDSHTLSVQAQATLMDPLNTSKNALIANDGTASPTVGPDGDVYIGVLENPFPSNHARGWLLHFSANLGTAKAPGAFGWDDTPSIVPASMVPSYRGLSSYLLMTKYNNYAGAGGDGVNKLAILDPNAMMADPVTGACVMDEVMTIAGPTPDPEYTGTHPNAVREWCINTAAVDPSTNSILANNEDGKLYRWDLTTNTFTEQVTLTSGIGEAYTPTLIGSDGTVYSINNAILFALGSSLNNANFEQPSLGAGKFQYRPTGTPWTFSGGAGISGNGSGFTAGNPPAPQGSQVAFVQSTGSFSQTVAGWAAGSYMITFRAAQRANYQSSRQDFQVLVDGVVVGKFTPSGSSYQSITTDPFTVTAGAHTVVFQGLNSVGGDNTAFIDAVTISRTTPPTIGDADFEQPSLGAGKFQYRPTGTPWTFSGGAGISGNGSGFTAGNPPAPRGSQVAFLQSGGSFSQTVAGWAAGSYVITFRAAQRAKNQASRQDFQVLVDGVVIGKFTPSGASYEALVTNVFTVAAGAHTIVFQGLNTAGGDNTAFIDAVAVSRATPQAIGDAGFEQPPLGAGKFQYRPTGTPWTFSGGAGISGNGSGFTAGNPPAPQGSQVAFVQSTGSFSQTVAGWAAGSYMITFRAAQRAVSQSSRQDFQVLVDGVVVGNFTPSGASYEALATNVFTVAAGAHTIVFQGLNTAGGDNTAFIDKIEIA